MTTQTIACAKKKQDCLFIVTLQFKQTMQKENIHAHVYTFTVGIYIRKPAASPIYTRCPKQGGMYCNAENSLAENK